MGQFVGTGSMAKCSFGLAPAVLNGMPSTRVMVEGVPVMTMADTATGVNIAPFGMCTTQSNPAVAAATAAALGTPTPSACVPVIAGPWNAVASTALTGGKPAVTSSSMCQCAYGGVITVINPSAKRSSTKP